MAQAPLPLELFTAQQRMSQLSQVVVFYASKNAQCSAQHDRGNTLSSGKVIQDYTVQMLNLIHISISIYRYIYIYLYIYIYIYMVMVSSVQRVHRKNLDSQVGGAPSVGQHQRWQKTTFNAYPAPFLYRVSGVSVFFLV